MRVLIINLIAILLLSSIFSVKGAYSSNNATSFSGLSTSEIKVAIPRRINVSGLDDINEYWDDSGRIRDDDGVCVYLNSKWGLYRVTAQGQNSNNKFKLLNHKNNKKINYTVKWRDSFTFLGYSSLTAGTPSRIFYSNNSSSIDCNGGSNASLRVNISKKQLEKALSSDTAYVDILTLTVAAV